MLLSAGEKLILWRVRRNLTQVQVSKIHKVGVDMYRDWEKDRRLDDQPKVDISGLKIHEEFLLLRIRANMAQSTLAKKIGITRQWVAEIESGRAPIGALQNYWEDEKICAI